MSFMDVCISELFLKDSSLKTFQPFVQVDVVLSLILLCDYLFSQQRLQIDIVLAIKAGLIKIVALEKKGLRSATTGYDHLIIIVCSAALHALVRH
jgi:hypothetical protein